MPNLLDDLDDEQRLAASAMSGPVCIIAGAGTGKTRTVTYRLANGIVSGGIDPNRCLAITHSKKAALELARRLHDLGAGAVDARTFHAAGLRVAGRPSGPSPMGRSGTRWPSNPTSGSSWKSTAADPVGTVDGSLSTGCSEVPGFGPRSVHRGDGQ